MNDATVAALVIVGGAVVLPLIWLIGTYNRFVGLRQYIRESWAAEHAADESALMREVGKLMVLVENYPQLKADQQFLALQKELAMTEDRIAAARRFYNGNIRDFNRLRETFPSNMVASMFNIETSPGFFELASDAERVVPRVSV